MCHHGWYTDSLIEVLARSCLQFTSRGGWRYQVPSIVLQHQPASRASCVLQSECRSSQTRYGFSDRFPLLRQLGIEETKYSPGQAVRMQVAVLIVGAGPTGLGAASRFHQHGLKDWLIIDKVLSEYL